MATNSKWLIANSPWLVALFCVCALSAQAQSNLDYRRNSLAMMLVFHPEDEFGEEIYKAFDSLPIPD